MFLSDIMEVIIVSNYVSFLKLHLFSEIKLQISKFQQFLKVCVIHMVTIVLYHVE
jgi:hypothetical protein